MREPIFVQPPCLHVFAVQKAMLIKTKIKQRRMTPLPEITRVRIPVGKTNVRLFLNPYGHRGIKSSDDDPSVSFFNKDGAVLRRIDEFHHAVVCRGNPDRNKIITDPHPYKLGIPNDYFSIFPC